jgi:hypothetical protein
LFTVGSKYQIGPLIYACVFAPVSSIENLKKEYEINWEAHHDEKASHRRYDRIRKLNYTTLGYFLKAIDPRTASNILLSEDPVEGQTLSSLLLDNYKKFLRLLVDYGFKIQSVFMAYKGKSSDKIINELKSKHP